MAESRIQIARPDIVRFFESAMRQIYRYADIATVLAENRSFWRLTQRMTTDEFIEYLVKSTSLRKLEFPFKRRKETRYVWNEVPILEVLVNLYPGSYLSHYAAVRAHGLTEQLPKSFYLNIEQPQRSMNTALSQRSIDFAFRQKPRLTSNVAQFKDYRIYQINGKASGQLGVIDAEVRDVLYDKVAAVRITGLERTLIDIAVRPMYSGGVHEVLKAYHLASSMASTNRLVAMLKQLDFTYPYHQVIGYYMEKAGGYPESTLELVRRIPQSFDFYLTNQMTEKAFVTPWRLWVPKGMEL